MSEYIQGVSTPEAHGQDPILVVATGGTSGLGFQALIDFAKQSKDNIILVLGCRSPAKPSISETLGSLEKVHKLDIFDLDLAKSDSIQAFAAYVLQTYSQNISVLLLCAGAVFSQRLVNEAGIEKTLQVNALSQALLLQCLWKRLVDSSNGGLAPSRVVFVASSLHKNAARDHEVSPSTIEDLLDDKRWKSMSAYSLSKLVQMHIFLIAVDSFAEFESGSTPIAIAVSPGFVPQTGLVREYPWWTRLAMMYIMPMLPFTTSLERGASTICEAMIRQDLTPGTYISPHGKESLAPQCLDTILRSQWRDWLVLKGFWMSNPQSIGSEY
ncbi:NAD(P)-binding protein [Ceratobasidium sp. AG-I]|nr:NAD(P)-binding protein [Ceratobasidium sp. AG-I]